MAPALAALCLRDGEVRTMASLVIVILLVAVALLAPFFGYDSRPRA